MDGWETRRRRLPGHDWCLIKLGIPGVIHGIEIDTAFFTGNHAPRFSLQATTLTNKEDACLIKRSEDMIGTAASSKTFEAVSKLQSENWKELIPMTPLQPGYEETRHNYFPLDSNEIWTHLRLNMYPDGGIARLRVFGEAYCEELPPDTVIDLISVKNGGVCKGYSNAHYGHPRNLIKTGGSSSMADGWETARRSDRPPVIKCDPNGILEVTGTEWAVFRLGYVGNVFKIEVDTKHFKGNFPNTVRIEGTLMKPTREWNTRAIAQCDWETIVPTSKLSGHCLHEYNEDCIKTKGPFSHIKISIAPDGGISRIRIFGNIVASLPR